MAENNFEADVRRMAQAVRPTIATSAGAPMPDARERVTVSHIHKALDQLQVALRDEADVAWRVVQQLTGASDAGAGQAPAVKEEGPVFERMARQITDVSHQLASLRRAHEALQRGLS